MTNILDFIFPILVKIILSQFIGKKKIKNELELSYNEAEDYFSRYWVIRCWIWLLNEDSKKWDVINILDKYPAGTARQLWEVYYRGKGLEPQNLSKKKQRNHINSFRFRLQFLASDNIIDTYHFENVGVNRYTVVIYISPFCTNEDLEKSKDAYLNFEPLIQ